MNRNALWSTAVAVLVATLAPPAAVASAVSDRVAAGTVARDTLGRVVPFPEIVVTTARASDHSPLARSVITREQLRSLNFGQDTPMALATLPGAYAYSDAGNGIGYSYLSVRGFPQRRISVLINGVPLNDPESHEVYWIDHPDLLASASEVELQRGVGSALYGAASLGGSVNLSTGPFGETPHTTALVSYGSYDTKRLMLESGSGALAGGWNLYGRYSRIETFGYRDRSFTKLWSYALSARRTLEHQSFRLNLYGGPEETHLAYLGIPGEFMRGEVTGNADRDRRFNPLIYPNERDHFFEPHYEWIHTWAPRERVTLSQTLFWFDGKGYYDEQRKAVALADYRIASWSTADSTLLPHDYYRHLDSGALVTDSTGRYVVERADVVRRRTVANRHYGWVPQVRIEHSRGALTVGGELRAHDGRHWGEVLSGSGLPPGTAPDLLYYDYHPRTLAAGLFAREEYALVPALLATADLAWRHQAYHVRDDHFDGIRFDQSYDFAVPRLGLTWTPRADLRAFASWSRAAREPALRDLFDGEGSDNIPLYAVADVARNVYRDPLVRPERVQDYEFGAAWNGTRASVSANLFRMDFRDELVYAGQFDTDLGYPILGNAARSVHQGVELGARAERRWRHRLSGAIEGNLTLSDNHFVTYLEHYGPTAADEVSYGGKAIGFFPATLANLSARGGYRAVAIGVQAQHAGRIYLDNTENILASAGPRTVLNLSGGVRVPCGGPALDLRALVLNVFDTRYATGGYMDYDAAGNLGPRFVPAAARHLLFEARVDF